MPSATCPKCGIRIDGSYKELSAHVRACKQCSTKKKKKVSRAETVRVVPPVLVPSIVLPVIIEVPLKIRSQNRSQYAHWSTYRTYRQAWYDAFPLYAKPIQGHCFPWSRWEIVRLYSGRERELDVGNLVGGAKPIPDVLVRVGAIPDDSPKHFKASYEQVRCERSGTIIRLVEIADAATK